MKRNTGEAGETGIFTLLEEVENHLAAPQNVIHRSQFHS
jgi:hypothetical protein